LRAVLNYGHTLGHAIESLSMNGRTRSGRLHHGEAISIGMVYAAAVAEFADVAKTSLVAGHRATLESVGLPTRIEGVAWNDVRDRMMVDKKYAKGLRFVLLKQPGETVVDRVPQKVLAKAFEEVSG
jgi:3-dehydroquinate synthase